MDKEMLKKLHERGISLLLKPKFSPIFLALLDKIDHFPATNFSLFLGACYPV
jgi:hypothetical protein